MGLQSSVYPKVSFTTASTIAIDTDIIPSSIFATRTSLAGDAGLYRVYFCINTTADADFEMRVRRKNATDAIINDRFLKLNGDNAFVLKSGGYYRFDIDVIAGDQINFQSTIEIASVPELRVHQVQIGA